MLTGHGSRPADPGSAVRPGADGGTRSGPPAGGSVRSGTGGVGWATAGTAPARPAEGPATWSLAALTLASAAGLFRVFNGPSWIWPVLTTVAVTHLVLWAMRRWRTGALVALPVALATMILMVIWTVFGSTTDLGFPGWHTWTSLVDSLKGLGHEFSATVAPVQPDRAFETLAAGGAGLLAVLGDWAAFRWRSPLLAILGGVAAFVACSTAGEGSGRAWVVGAEVLAACVFLLVYRCSAARREVWFAGVRSGEVRWTVTGGAVLGAAALVASVALAPALATRDGLGALGWRAGPGGGGERVVPNPVVSLQTRLIKLSNTPVFVVDSTQPSYWRLTSLDTFNGTTWTATGAYRDFRSRLPGVGKSGPGTRPVRATFQIQQLDSVWLPEQLNPVAVEGVSKVAFDPMSGSLIASSSTSNGLAYTVDSVQYLNTLTPAALNAAPPVRDSAAISADLEVPAVVDGAITQLALELTAGQATEYGKALAIQNYLRSPQFRYKLQPVSDGFGSQALYNFLFLTRQGYCQQFAGAFAVLARAAGIPTRLAVGFATGTPMPAGGFQVYDRDAHTWPEVYFGPGFGWLPFEPTPGFAVPGTSRYSGIPSPSGGTAVPVPTTVPAGSNLTPPSIQKSATPTTSRGSATTLAPGAGGARSGLPGWLGVLVIIPALGVLWAAGNVGLRTALRRRRRRRAERAGPGAVILDLWQDICSELSWVGIGRSPAETDDEFARRATADLHRRVIGGPARREERITGLSTLAGLARRATFAPAVPEDLVDRAGVSAAQVRQLLHDHTTRTERVRRCLSLPPGRWAQLTGPLRR